MLHRKCYPFWRCHQRGCARCDRQRRTEDARKKRRDETMELFRRIPPPRLPDDPTLN